MTPIFLQSQQLLLVLEGRNLTRVPVRVLPEGVIDWEGGLHVKVGGLSLTAAVVKVRADLAKEAHRE